MELCSIEGCAHTLLAQGWCAKHYYRWKRYGDPHFVVRPSGPPLVRFWHYVDKNGPVPECRPNLGACWCWMGSVGTKPGSAYGAFSVEGRSVYAHRWAYEQFIGPVPDGLELDHLCRNPTCVRPDHLEAVTHTENIRRGRSPAVTNAAKTHCPQGHPYDEGNTYITHDGRRACRICLKDQHREAWANQLRGDEAPARPRHSHCSRGHALTNENSIISAEGFQKCRQCSRDRSRESARRRRGITPDRYRGPYKAS